MNDNMDNDELIEKYEEISVEQLKLLKIILTRQRNGDFTSEQYGRVQEIATKLGANLIDSFLQNADKREIKNAVDGAINLCTDKNR